MAVSATIDRKLLQTYLADHATGAAATRARARKMTQWYADNPIGPDLTRTAQQLDDEYDHLRDLIDRLGLRQPLVKRTLARAGELGGRLKLNGRVVAGSPMSPLLELEVLRSGVIGKLGLWQTLVDYSGELSLDPNVYRAYADQAQEQLQILETLHAGVRASALRPQAEQNS